MEILDNDLAHPRENWTQRAILQYSISFQHGSLDYISRWSRFNKSFSFCSLPGWPFCFPAQCTLKTIRTTSKFAGSPWKVVSIYYATCKSYHGHFVLLIWSKYLISFIYGWENKGSPFLFGRYTSCKNNSRGQLLICSWIDEALIFFTFIKVVMSVLSTLKIVGSEVQRSALSFVPTLPSSFGRKV